MAKLLSFKSRNLKTNEKWEHITNISRNSAEETYCDNLQARRPGTG